MQQDDWLRLIYLLALLALIGPGIWAMSRRRGTIAAYLAIWAIIGAAIFLAAMLYQSWPG